MRTIILTACLAMPAAAQDTVAWGQTFCRMTLTPDKPHVAEIACHNYLTGGVTNNEGALAVDGLMVSVIATFQPGRIPDRFEVLVPDGFYAEPPMIDVMEEQAGVIRVVPWVGY